MKIKLILLILLMVFCTTSVSYAAIPHVINFQGKATDKANVPLDGTYKLTFRIYDAVTGGNLEWTEIHDGVAITNGIFQVPLNVDLPFNEDYWISVEVNADKEMSPRTQLASVGYAYRAEKSEETEFVSIPFYIQGLELEYETPITIKVTPGAADISGRVLAAFSPSASINIEIAANYIDGKLPGPDAWIYVYAYNDENNIAYILSAEEPEKVGAAYRCIGAIRKGADGKLLKFNQVKDTIYYVDDQSFACGSASTFAEADLTAVTSAIDGEVLLAGSNDGMGRYMYFRNVDAQNENYQGQFAYYSITNETKIAGWFPVLPGSSYARAIDYKTNSGIMTGYVTARRLKIR